VPYLKLLADDGAHEVRAPQAMIGRDPAATIGFGPEAKVVSGRHAELRHADDGWHIRDLQSRNGVFVNGRRVAGEARLAVGDEIRLGETGPRFRVAAVSEDAAVPATRVERSAIAASEAAATAAVPAGSPRPAPPPPAPEIRPYAITLLAADSGRRFEARGTRIRIGRGKECEIRPVEGADAAVSRVHAELLVGATGALTLQDAGSTNGTLLNGERLTAPTPVRLGDRIQLGAAGPALIVEGLGTSPGFAAMRKDGLGQETVMGMIGAALARARAEQAKGRRTSLFVREISERLQGDARRRTRVLSGVIVVLVVLFAGGVYGVYRLLSGEVAQTEQAVQSVEDSARAEVERLRRELAEARAASAPAAEVERLRAALDSAQATSAELRAALERAQSEIQSQLTAAESRRAQSEVQVQRLREQLSAAERRALNPAVVDSLRRAVAAAESQTAQMTARLRAVRSADFASVAQQTQAAVGLITVRLGGDYFDGTGFVISSDGYMLTNWHVVADTAHEQPDTVWVTMADESRGRLADVVATSRERDLALVRVRGYQGPWLSEVDWDGTRARQGDPAALIGFPAGSGFARDRTSVVRTSMTAGILSRVTADLIQFDGMTTGGSSGSPVVNSNGEVVSIHRAGLRQGPGFALSVPVRYAVPLFPPSLRQQLKLSAGAP
jgi:pSer/pThr/pTyr-binding forkhead associated (FHA) protein/S1-C subfamily serine protease